MRPNASFCCWPGLGLFLTRASLWAWWGCFYYFFLFKTIIRLLRSGRLPQRLSLDLGSHYFPLPLPRHYCSITMLDFFSLSFSRPSLWHLLAEISGLLPQNLRRGDTSLGIAARADGLQQGLLRLCVSAFFSLCFVFALVLLALRGNEQAWFWLIWSVIISNNVQLNGSQFTVGDVNPSISRPCAKLIKDVNW